jgi:hypothetical protein
VDSFTVLFCPTENELTRKEDGLGDGLGEALGDGLGDGLGVGDGTGVEDGLGVGDGEALRNGMASITFCLISCLGRGPKPRLKSIVFDL